MIINLLFIITGLFGFLTVIITMSNYIINRMMNRYLIFIFLLIAIRFLLFGIFPFGYLGFLQDYYVNYSKFLILIIPSFYLYFKNLIADEKLFLKSDLAHFIFPVVFLALNISIVSTYNFLTNAFYFSSYSVLFLYNIVYCFLAYDMLNKNIWAKREVSQVVNKHNRLIKYWTILLFSLLIINSLKLFTALFLDDNNHHGFIAGERFQWIGAIVWISTFIKILISPEILYGYPIFNNTIKEEKKPIKVMESDWIVEINKDFINLQDRKLKEKIDKNIVQYIVQIEKVSKEFEFFKDSRFSISDLAVKLNIPKSNLNYLFKYHSKISFSDYKKKIRIHHSIRLIESNYLKTNTLDTLAKEVGFASYNPFFTSFKKITGNSPQKHIAQQNEIP
ncbi:helix-turn-helix transcriptional regulator [Flavobacterium franklandianum]|nr:helix-turn-helix transcriptional regulator [Flavobacterium franklandianum]